MRSFDSRKSFFIAILIVAAIYYRLYMSKFILITSIFVVLLEFRDYKVTINNDEIYFHKIFKKNFKIKLSEIHKFEIESYEWNLFFFETRLQTYVNSDIYDFNITTLSKKKLFKELIEKSAVNNIVIEDKSKKSIFYDWF